MQNEPNRLNSHDHPHLMNKSPSRKSIRPIIRPGQRVAYQKGSPGEIDRRRKYIAGLLARGLRKMEIHRRTRKRFNRQWRTVDRDIEFITRGSRLEGVSCVQSARVCAREPCSVERQTTLKRRQRAENNL
jgi:hypothetical protein